MEVFKKNTGFSANLQLQRAWGDVQVNGKAGMASVIAGCMREVRQVNGDGAWLGGTLPLPLRPEA